MPGGSAAIPVTFLAAFLTAFLAIAAAAPEASALEWPVEGVRIAATFGTPSRGRFVTGVALAEEDGLVRSSSSGEMVFASEEGRDTSGFPSPLGSYMVVEHPDGILALYARMEPGSLSTYLGAVRPDSILGSAGASGYADGRGALFQIYDRRDKQWVNPLLLLPLVEDRKPPVIRSMALVGVGGTFPMGEVPSVKQGTYMIVVEASDPAEADWTAGPLAPYSILLAVNGTEVARDLFDVARGEGGRLILFPASPRGFTEFRTRDGRYMLAERLLPRGKTHLEVITADAAGNRRSASWTVLVE